MKHTCHALECESVVPERMFMCLPHWRRLPKHHKDAVNGAYVRGQEIRKDPSLRYRVVSYEAILALAILDNASPERIAEHRKTLEWLKAKLPEGAA